MFKPKGVKYLGTVKFLFMFRNLLKFWGGNVREENCGSANFFKMWKKFAFEKSWPR
jgi:hypothetical protein